MAAKKVLAEIRQDLEACIGKKVRLQANRGRKKVVERVGVLEQTYPHIFVVKLDEKGDSVRRVSYSYIDVLTETVKLIPYSEEEE
ncbi:MAG: Veg family protein [Clostridia bacterium]|nr:Veg family protein [Clostridia bacterium]MDH7573351.1 Veg family protein [Clostridia bacterium]